MKVPLFRQLPETTRTVLECLSDGEFHSGWDLADALGLSRVAIWKIIQALKAEGLPIETHRRWGYCLRLTAWKPVSLLSESTILSLLASDHPDLPADLEFWTYHFSPLADFGRIFFEHRRPLTDIAICFLDTQGTPRTPLTEHFHVAIALDSTRFEMADLTPYLLQRLFPETPLAELRYHERCDTLPGLTVLQWDISTTDWAISKNILAAKLIGLLAPMVFFSGSHIP